MTAVAVAAIGVTWFGAVGCDGAAVVGGFVGAVTGHTVETGVAGVDPPAAIVTLTVVAPGEATTVRCWLPGAEVTTPPDTVT